MIYLVIVGYREDGTTDYYGLVQNTYLVGTVFLFMQNSRDETFAWFRDDLNLWEKKGKDNVFYEMIFTEPYDPIKHGERFISL